MSYQDDLVEENNALRNELNEKNATIENLDLRVSRWRSSTIRWAVAAWALLVVLVAGVMFMQVRAPLSANTRGAAKEFCDALDKQTREEQEQ